MDVRDAYDFMRPHVGLISPRSGGGRGGLPGTAAAPGPARDRCSTTAVFRDRCDPER
jgi:hypothetical protein